MARIDRDHRMSTWPPAWIGSCAAGLLAVMAKAYRRHMQHQSQASRRPPSSSRSSATRPTASATSRALRVHQGI